MSDGRIYRSDDIEIARDQLRCIHVGACVQGLPEVFAKAARPWVQPGNAAADAIAEVVQRCPTGALRFQRLDCGTVEPVPEETSITADPGGPLFIRGPVTVTNHRREVVAAETRVALCGCVASENKPFCDGSHERVGFVAD